MSRPHRKKKPHRRNEAQPKPEPVVMTIRPGAVLRDDDEKQLVIFSSEMLINQLRRDGPSIEASFDRLCDGELRELSSFLSTTLGMIYTGLKSSIKRDDELRSACAQLLLNASNSFAASVAVLRMGYVLQPGIMIRSLIEATSTALHLIQHPVDLAKYKNHTLHSPNTIAAAKTALPPFGQLYGYFSDNFAHIGRLHKSVTPLREFTERHEALNLNLSSLRMAAWLLYVTSELAFNHLLDEPRYWFPVEGGFKYDPSAEERTWMSTYFGVSSAA